MLGYTPHMALTIVIRSGDDASLPRLTFDSPRVVIGRGDGCDVRLPDPSVSHRHASIRQRGTDYIVLDEGSTNGTFVGPVRLSPHAPRLVRSGDLVRIGRIWLEILIEQALPTTNPAAKTSEIALGLVAEALAAQGERNGARVLVTEGPDAGRELALAAVGRVYTLGRGQEADLVLTDPDASRRHVEVFRRGVTIFVRELGSKNGTLLDGEKLVTERETRWPAGATLSIGADRMSFEDPVAEALLELERVADERMAEDDSVDPPNTEDESEPPPPASVSSEARGAAPIAEVPRRTPERRVKRAGWTVTDVVVALIALGVLGMSIVGLLWLFGSQ